MSERAKGAPKHGRKIVSFEELAHSNMLVNEALIGLLSEKGLVSRPEILERISKLRSESPTQVLATPTDQVVASREDLIASDSLATDLLLDLLMDKDFLSETEIDELKSKMKKRARDLLRTH